SESPERRLDRRLLPFLKGDDSGTAKLSDELQLTLKFKENYGRNPREAKAAVMAQADCPNIPHALWSVILAGDFVDLDVVYTGHYSLAGDPEVAEAIGKHIITTSAKPSKHVAHHGDWTIAWAIYREAVEFVFPHRVNEMLAYQRHIVGMFAAVTGAPQRVIDYDKAVRIRVGRSNRLELSDFNEFHDLNTMYISAPHAGSSAARYPASSQGPCPRSNDICIRFNEGQCTIKACRYRHACSNCHGASHAAFACKQDTAGAGPSKPAGRK
ncbi:hypothetical protein BV25DRAFT_1816392, partial [Artomyces pyxidatus]